MSETKTRLGLFEGYGIEIEYMIADEHDLHIMPIADTVLLKAGLEDIEENGEVDVGRMSWSNELVRHVIEVKNNGPVKTLNDLDIFFYESVVSINNILKEHKATLLGTAMHPLFSPSTEKFELWPFGNKDIYNSYHRIFNCSGHGWSNLQSMHINLPFKDESEFARLHAAIRVLLPILPHLSASSPLVEGRVADKNHNDWRLVYYEQNQKKVPIITGHVIPEALFSTDEYKKFLESNVYPAIAPHDPEGILQHTWLNSRGAIPKFDLNAIEIRILDSQEAPCADIAIATFVVEILKHLVFEKQNLLQDQQSFSAEFLKSIYDLNFASSDKKIINDKKFLKLFGISQDTPISFQTLWETLYTQVKTAIPERYRSVIEVILEKGNLGERIRHSLPENPSKGQILELYLKLARCLRENKIYKGP